ncbi:AcrR family transcriptional regulator [Catalinimonas alkaloidigena]|uniref:TetR/AcrR family transcriptional regulator n=1 Tax=Catalinimonas alkaloidigena TaxID=1075417 RepID=UPI0024062679|nr:TetR/AcrR family transcriptional regulator [Catalinimonas alkaloidigena]MDF9796199.1 AcrR family transcriptional regulator [Catalinimonas alkaloidigena]
MITLALNEKYFLKDPQHTDLGTKIVSSSIQLIDELGFEQFTFKKLAKEIHSTEASIYRYFENKHKLLMYLIAWYWKWMEYLIDYRINNIEEAERKLDIALKTLCEEVNFDPNFVNIDEIALRRIVVSESNKTYLTKHVDEDNKEGLFRGYKSLCRLIANLVKEYNPDFMYPHALISTVIEASHQQAFFAQHLPSLTEVQRDDPDMYNKIFVFLQHLVMSAINRA